MASIKRAGRDKWKVRIFLGRDKATGKQNYQNSTVTGTEKEAKAWANEQEKRLGVTSGAAIKVNYKVDELLDDLLHNYRVNGKSIEWAEIVVRHLRPVFGDLVASRVTTTHATDYQATRLAIGRKNATVNRELSLLRRSFYLALRSTPPKIHAVPYIPELAENNVRQGFFEDDAYNKVMAAHPEFLRPVIAFGYETAVREGEILVIQWHQLDQVNRSVRLAKDETKGKEARTIPLTPQLFKILMKAKAKREQNYPQCPWMFADDEGRRVTKSRLYKYWCLACKTLGEAFWVVQPVQTHEETAIPEKPLKTKEGPAVRFHDFRRTGIRNYVRGDVQDGVAMKISGHKTRAVFDRYNIINEADVLAAAPKLERYHRERRKAEKALQRQVTRRRAA